MNAGPASGVTHVIGAGLAGLAAAVVLAGAGRQVRLYEAAGHAGGRCRSYFDAELGCRLDNGNHLLLSGNHQAVARWRAEQSRRQPEANTNQPEVKKEGEGP